jgi:hypothetical protein
LLALPAVSPTPSPKLSRKAGRKRLWLLGLGAGALVLACIALAMAILIPSEEALAQALAAKLEAALGAKVSLRAVRWHLLPSPVVVLEDAVIEQAQPITVRQLTLHPNLGALWQRHLKIDLAELDGAVVPLVSLRSLNKQDSAAASLGDFSLGEIPLQRFVFRDVTWITRRGIPVIFGGEAVFDAGWRPRNAVLRRPGIEPLTDLLLTRQGQQDRWDIVSNLGGGSVNGSAQLQTLPSGLLHLSGQLQPTGVEVSAALTAFNRRPAIAGKASGHSTLSASGATAFELAQTLQTQTTFAIGTSKLLRFDLNKAIRTLGKDHAGQTPLDAISGKMQTQNTPDGMVVTFSDIHAKSGALSASGKARLFNRQVDAELAVDLVDGLVGVPLKITGPVNAIKVSVPAGAVVGAVVGTAVLPVIGTAIGARLGAALGKIMGSGSVPKGGPSRVPVPVNPAPAVTPPRTTR